MILIAVLAGGSMAAYSQSEVNFLRKTIQLGFFSTVHDTGYLFNLFWSRFI
ncbi:hypothetical protein CWATWH8502_4954 [Crocosphaera watsonii WH 8502]|uniref:Uncharacterized protein n=1 Tax=Crocosphaera watsonii WH 8502 TaxID=423474 RepID=T2IIF8_CROWT|nr:hypothetical protein CWATWH8502_4954 [Crocosphaera watsonii WH 8502]